MKIVYLLLCGHLALPVVVHGRLNIRPTNHSNVEELPGSKGFDQAVENRFFSESENHHKRKGPEAYEQEGPHVHPNDDCSKFTVTFRNEEDTRHLHLPESAACLGHLIDQHRHGKCDKKKEKFPMKCTFYTIDKSHEVDERDITNYLDMKETFVDESMLNTTLYSAERRGRTRVPKGRKDLQFDWVAAAALKIASANTEKACKPRWRTQGTKMQECSVCYKRWWWPYACKCTCGGWNYSQTVPGMCWQSCHGEYSLDLNTYHCFKPCDRHSQVALNVGCGFTRYDRNCVASNFACVKKFFNIAVSLGEVIAFFCSGGTSGALKTGVKTAIVAGAQVAGKEVMKIALREALRQAAQEMAAKLSRNKFIQSELIGLGPEEVTYLLEQGSELFITASLGSDPSYGAIALKIATTVDPTGIIGLAQQFIPAEDCDKMVEMESVPGERFDLPLLDALAALNDFVPTSGDLALA